MEFLLVFTVVLALAWGVRRLWRSAPGRSQAGSRLWTVTVSAAVVGFMIGYFVMALGFLIVAGNFDVGYELGMSDLAVVSWICAGSGFLAGIAAVYAAVGRAVPALGVGVLGGALGGAVLWLIGSAEPVLTEILSAGAASILLAVAAASWLRHIGDVPRHAGRSPVRHLPAH